MELSGKTEYALVIYVGFFLAVNLTGGSFFADVGWAPYIQSSSSSAPSGSAWIEGQSLRWADGSNEYRTTTDVGRRGRLVFRWYSHSSGSHPTTHSEMDDYFGGSVGTLEARGSHANRINWHSGTALPDAKPSYLPADYYAWKAEGYIYAPESGTYTFGVDSDDASEVIINGNVVASWYGGHGTQGSGSPDYSGHTGTISLDKGWHKFKARMEEQTGGDGLSVGWQKPSDSSLSVVPANNFAEPVNPALVGNYRMDSGSGSTAVDSSMLNNDGTINGATWTSGRFDDALSFDGNSDYVSAPGKGITGSDSRTISAWMYPTVDEDWYHNNNEQWAAIIDFPEAENTHESFMITVADGGSCNREVSIHIWGDSVCSGETLTSLGLDQWHHVTAVHDESAGEQRIYINGDLKATGTYSINTPSGPIQIGRRSYSSKHYFNGRIDEARIYDRALSQQEIENLYRGSGSRTGATAGSIWIEENTLHWGTPDGIERAFTGSDTGNNVGNAGNMWIENGYIHYIDQNGNERVMN